MAATERPLISVVVPVYGVREYLTECLDSVLGGSGADGLAEVVAVDDASRDGSADVLDARAAADARLTVIHLERTLGPGNARNVGLARAAGEYVWFVDGDDVVTAHALAAISARLEQDRPDLLLIDYQELFPDGRSRPSPGAALLRRAPAGTFTLDEAPDLVNLSMTAWSKLFRREFLLGLDQPFAAGIHEDIPVSCAALLGGRLGVLNRVCYSYRRDRRASFMSTTTSGHQAVFSSYELVLARLDKLAATDDPVATTAVQSALFERAIWHYAAVLQAGVVPRGERRAFFERMNADFVRYAPPGYRFPRGARGAKLRLIRYGAYRLYEVLEPLNALRVRRRGLRAMSEP
jgi:CDP-glycerol glycerophosphotransferase